MNEKSVVRWDKYQTVKDAIQSKQPQLRLMVICFAEQWNRTSTHAAQSFERIRMSGDLPFAQIFILDAFSDREASFDYQVEVTPAVVFLWDGSVLNVQRPNWDDDCKFVGATSEENYISLIRYARETGEKGSKDLIADL